MQAGDSLTTIAAAHDIKVEDLSSLNRLQGDLLSVGLELDLPGCEPVTDPVVCIEIPFEFIVRSVHGDVRCEFVQISDIDKHPLMNAGVKTAVEIWGRVDEGVEICFSGGGTLVFMDSSESPPAASRLGLYGSEDVKCARITRDGTVVHVLPLSEDESIPLNECTLTTANVVRLRDVAGGNEILALVPFRVTLNARARTASWFFVDFMGMDGWVSADYVQTQGTCD